MSQTQAAQVVPVRPKTKEMENLLQAGYQMTIAEAKRLIKAREENPQSVPWDTYQQAKAMIAAYETQATVVSTRPGWTRSTNAQLVGG